MTLEILKKSLDILVKYDKEMFYIVEENSISIGNEGLIDKMSVEDVGRLITYGWKYDHDEEFFIMTTKRTEG